MKKVSVIIFALTLIVCMQSCNDEDKDRNLTDFVNTLQTVNNEQMTVAAALPFGDVRLSRNSECTESVACTFSHLHRNNENNWVQDLRMLPVGDKPDVDENITNFINANCSEPIKESAEPAYYRATFENGILAEVALTDNCVFHYYQYPAGCKRALTLDLTTACDSTLEAVVTKISDRRIEGSRKSGKQTMYFVMEFSQDIEMSAGDGSLLKLENGDTFRGKKCYAWIDFGTKTDKILLKLSTSTKSCEDAMANINRELTHWSFDKVKKDGKRAWNKELSTIKIESTNKDDMKKFYTDLYCSYLSACCIMVTGNKRRYHTLSLLTDSYFKGDKPSADIFEAIGLNPVKSDEYLYQFTIPKLDKISIKTGPEKFFEIRVKRNSDNSFGKDVLLNGKPVEHKRLSYDEIMKGGKLDFILNDEK
ncbi:MAG: glycoside hydrolase family 92 protein [Culturomica sp.]|jgi:putative alpha-1,2-mannosidase|nr:glycoside hydrolase family 92 protein [Culturomica sp.]